MRFLHVLWRVLFLLHLEIQRRSFLEYDPFNGVLFTPFIKCKTVQGVTKKTQFKGDSECYRNLHVLRPRCWLTKRRRRGQGCIAFVIVDHVHSVSSALHWTHQARAQGNNSTQRHSEWQCSLIANYSSCSAIANEADDRKLKRAWWQPKRTTHKPTDTACNRSRDYQRAAQLRKHHNVTQ